MKTNLVLNFKDNKDLQNFLTRNADIVDMGSIPGVTLASMDEDFLGRFKNYFNLHKLFVQSIKTGDISKIRFCLNNGVSYNSHQSHRESLFINLDSKTPIDVAFLYGQREVVEIFLDEGFLDEESILEFVYFIMLCFRGAGHSREILLYGLSLIAELFDRYEIDPDYNGGSYLNIAVEGKYDLSMDLIEFLVAKGANVHDLELCYVKGTDYFLRGLRYLNQFLNDNAKIDVDFFITGSFSETK